MYFVHQRKLEEILEKARGNESFSEILDGIGPAGALLKYVLCEFSATTMRGERVLARESPRLRQLRTWHRPKLTRSGLEPRSTQLRQALILLIRAASVQGVADREPPYSEMQFRYCTEF